MNSKWLILFGLALASFAVVVALGNSSGNVSPFPVDFSVNGTPVAQRSSVNIIEGTAVTVTGVDSGLLTGVEYTVNSSAVGGGTHPVNLASDVSGIAAVINGGTGTSVITSSEVVIGNGTGAVTTVSTGTVGFVLTSTGATVPTWQAAAGGGSPAHGRFADSGGNYFVLPGVHSTGLMGTENVATDRMYYMPIYVETDITVDRMYMEVTGAGIASTTTRIGIYDAGIDWQPEALVLDAGTVATDATGQAIIDHANTVLTAGRYLIAHVSDGSPTFRKLYGTVDGFGIDTTFDTSPIIYRVTLSAQAAQHSGGFSDPGVDWDTIAAGAQGFYNMTLLDVVTP